MAFTQKQIGIAFVIVALVFLVILTLLKTNQDDYLAQLCDLSHEQHLADEGECPYHKSSSSWLIMVAFGIVFLVGGAGVFLMAYSAPPGSTAQRDYAPINRASLDDGERRIYDFLKEKQG